jgi:hypothetical protein
VVQKRSKEKKGLFNYIREKSIIIFPIILLPLFSFYHSAFSQKLASTQDGDIVILFKDGTWKYAPTDQIDNTRNHGCSYEINQSRSDSTQRKSVLKKETFISHSYSSMKNTERYSNYVHCDLAIGEVGENKIVYLEYTLQTPYGLYNHGIIQEGKKILLKLSNNTTVGLILKQTDKGEVDMDNSETRYHTYALIPPKYENELKKNAVNAILMPWSKGNEIYTVAYPRIFIDQLFCFD